MNPTKVLIENLCKEIATRDARLAALRTIYDRYRHEDAWIMDPLFLLGDSHRRDHVMIRALWEAVKAAVEGEHATQT